MPNKRSEAKTKKTGTVTAFNEKRGVGYIDSDEPEDTDLYVVHQSEIDLPGYSVLETGQFVEFEVAAEPSDSEDSSEPAAENVRPSSSA